MTKYLFIILTVILTVLTIGFVWIFFTRLNIPYNSEGNYFDESSGIVYREQSVLVLRFLVLASLALTFIAGTFALKKMKIK